MYEASINNARILVIGSANVDLVVQAPDLPKPGETLLGGEFNTFSGGKGANQAVAAARAGGVVAMLGRVGRDNHGDRLRADLEAAGVDVSGLATEHSASGVALIVTAANGENAIVVAPGANNFLDAAAVEHERRLFDTVTHVLAQLETPLEGVVRAAQLARAREKVFILDPAPARVLPAELLSMLDWLTPNEREARALLDLGEGPFDAMDAARALQLLGARNVIVKLSSKGAVLLEEGGDPLFIPAWPVEAIDTTAAGDAFNGAFAVALAEGRTSLDAALFAATAAAISVTRRGAQPSMPTRGEIDAAQTNWGNRQGASA